MRIAVSTRNKGNIKRDVRLSKSSCRSRLGCSVENEILEKILVFNNSLIIKKHSVYAIINLKAYHNR